MKHLKKYENITSNKMFWETDSSFGRDEHKDIFIFKKSLQKIGCPDDVIQNFLYQFDFYNSTKIYVGVELTIDGEMEWSASIFRKIFNSQGYENQYNIHLTPKEYKEASLERKMSKYNL